MEQANIITNPRGFGNSGTPKVGAHTLEEASNIHRVCRKVLKRHELDWEL
jgi:hypothetical protein